MHCILKRFCFLLCILLLAAGWISCARTTSTDADGQAASGALFRHRWWNYYLRGVERADQQQYEAARADLKHAMQRRDGDQRMARTYGMRYMDYFAHRELGIVHWRSDDLDAARAELERSIQDAPSAKARFYLDRVRKAIIQRDGAQPGAQRIHVDHSGGVHWTRDDPVILGGRIQDPNFVSQVTVHGQALYMAGSQTDFKFEHRLALPQGRHSVAIKTRNLAAQTRRKTIDIAVDRQGPWVVLSTAVRQNGRTRIEGQLFDAVGVAALTVNQRPVALTPGSRASFSLVLDPEQMAVDMMARDRLGNATRVRIPKSHWRALAKPRILVAAADTGALVAGLFGGRDTDAPLIHLEDWDETQTVYLDKVVISGSVRDSGKVTRLTINDAPVLPQAGPMVVFSHFVALQPGRNTISMQAQDASGNTSRKQLVIFREVPQALLLDHRLSLSVFAFEAKGRVTSTSFAFQDAFIDQLVGRRRFRVIERQRLDLILEEQKLSRSQLLDPATALQMGRLSAAQVIVTGQMVQTRSGIEIVGRVIDCETSEILTTADAYSEAVDLQGFKQLAGTLALKIHRDFPLVDGIVIEKQGALIFTDLGTPKIRAQRRLLVYDDRPVRHPSSGAHLGMDHHILAKARVVQCDATLSKAELQKGFDPAIRPHHKVITQ